MKASVYLIEFSLGMRTGLTKFTLFETVYVILLNIHKMQPNQRRQRCLPHFVRQKSIAFPGPSPDPNPIPINPFP